MQSELHTAQSGTAAKKFKVFTNMARECVDKNHDKLDFYKPPNDCSGRSPTALNGAHQL